MSLQMNEKDNDEWSMPDINTPTTTATLSVAALDDGDMTQATLTNVLSEVRAIRKRCDYLETLVRQMSTKRGAAFDEAAYSTAARDIGMGGALPALDRLGSALRSHSYWMQSEYPREDLKKGNKAWVKPHVWSATQDNPRGAIESKVRDAMTQVLDGESYDPTNPSGHLFELLKVITLQTAINDLHIDRPGNGGPGSNPNVDALDERQGKIYTAWDELSGYLSSLKSNGIKVSRLYPSNGGESINVPVDLFRPNTDEAAVTSALQAAETLVDLIKKQSVRLKEQEHSYGGSISHSHYVDWKD